MSGGFIIEPSYSRQPQQEEPDGRKPLQSLTKRQESRLLAHLDEKLLNLERDNRKHAFTSLLLLIKRLEPLIQLILQIPPRSPWGYLRVTYLLTLTSLIPTYITSLPLIPTRTRQSSRTSTAILTTTKEPQSSVIDVERPTPVIQSPPRTRTQTSKELAQETLLDLLNLLNLLDKAWQTVIQGYAWLPPLPLSPVSNSTTRTQTTPRQPGYQISSDFSVTLDQTERTRLKSMVIAGREKVIAWARVYGVFPGERFGDSSEAEDGERGGVQGTGRGLISGVEGGGDDWETQILGWMNGTLNLLSEYHEVEV